MCTFLTFFNVCVSGYNMDAPFFVLKQIRGGGVSGLEGQYNSGTAGFCPIEVAAHFEPITCQRFETACWISVLY